MTVLLLGLALTVGIAGNLGYIRCQRRSFEPGEAALVMRRAWIPGYWLYHDALFRTAQVDEIALLLTAITTMLPDAILARWRMGDMDTWSDQVTDERPRPDLYLAIIPFAFTANHYAGTLIGLLVATAAYRGIITAWQLLAIVASKDRLAFLSNHRYLHG